MLDIVVYRSGSQWSTSWEDYFIKGLKKHGEKFEERPKSDIRVSDLAVIWAHRQKPLFDMQRQAGKDYLVMERGYLGDRYKWTSLGLNGLNGRATFPPPRDIGEKFHRHFGHRLRPWREGEYAIVMGQVPGDASVKGIDINGWAFRQCAELVERGYKVKYRPHPLNDDNTCPQGVELSREYLDNDLANAWLVVTYNSNSGVDAVLKGVPTVAMDEGSMAWRVTSHSLDEPLYKGDRMEWANQLTWCQWSSDEISKGIAWDSIKGLLS